MMWSDNWGWAWTALIIAMVGFWLIMVWAAIAPSDDDSCSCDRRRADEARHNWRRRTDRRRTPHPS